MKLTCQRLPSCEPRCEESFQQKYGVKLGILPFFVKAAVEALQEFPAVNAEVRGTDIVYRNSYHIGIAIGAKRGLVVPVLRDADRLSFAQIELAIDDFAAQLPSRTNWSLPTGRGVPSPSVTAEFTDRCCRRRSSIRHKAASSAFTPFSNGLSSATARS